MAGGDIADLVAKLDALEKEATPGLMGFVPACKHDNCQPNGGGCLPTGVGWQEPDGSINLFAFWNYSQGNGQPDKDAALIVALRNAYPRLRAIVVAAQAYVEARGMEDIGRTYGNLVAAVRCEV